MAYDKGRIDSKELLVIKKVDPQAPEGEQKYGKNGYTLRVVQWLFEGKGRDSGAVKGSVAFEKRETYLTEDGELRSGKAKGFDLADLSLVQQNWKDIIAVMKDAPVPAWPEKAAQPAKAQPQADAVLEDVPF